MRKTMIASIMMLGVFAVCGFASASTLNQLQPASTIEYSEPVVVNSSIEVQKASYFDEGLHIGSTKAGIGGVAYLNGSIVNASVDGDGEDTIPVTIGDDLRVDGAIWRGESGTNDNLALMLDDNVSVAGTLTTASTATFGSNIIVSGNASLAGNMTVTGNVTIDGTLTGRGVPAVAGGNTLLIGSDTFIDGDINATGDTNITGKISSENGILYLAPKTDAETVELRSECASADDLGKAMLRTDGTTVTGWNFCQYSLAASDYCWNIDTECQFPEGEDPK